MNYQQTLKYLYSELPMFQRVGAVAYKKDLSNTIRLCAALGDPQRKFKSIHVAGTNGKGSSCHMIAAILQSQGYKTGLYTSPHLKEFTERIRINGQEVSQEFVVEFVDQVKPLIESIRPSFFEITVAMAYAYFAAEAVDIAVIEVGLGGRLDSTNVIHPELSLITNIGYDHKDILGDTLEQIAKEKAGIIKQSVPVVISEHQAEIAHIFEKKAEEMKAQIQFADHHYKILRNNDMTFDVLHADKVQYASLQSALGGSYQRKNLAGVIASIDVIRSLGYSISDESVRNGIEHTISMTGLKGRWQKLGEQPLIYCDTAHNAEGISEVVSMIKNLSYSQLHMVVGMVKDKDHSSVLSQLPKDAIYYFCKAEIPRALDPSILSDKALAHGLKGKVYERVTDAIHQAKQNAEPDDLIFIGGSTFVVAEIEEL